MTGYLRHSLITAVCTATFLTSGICQQGEPRPQRRCVPVAKLFQAASGHAGAAQRLATTTGEQSFPGRCSNRGQRVRTSRPGDRKVTALIVRLHAIGSGMIVHPDGYIMTNAHVVAGAQRIRVVLSVVSPTFDDVPRSGKVQVLEAKIVGMQKQADLALLKVEATNLPTLRFNLDRKYGHVDHIEIGVVAQTITRTILSLVLESDITKTRPSWPMPCQCWTPNGSLCRGSVVKVVLHDRAEKELPAKPLELVVSHVG